MAVAESRQMAALPTGMDLTLCITSRLKVYFDYYRHLSSALASKNFEKALVKAYAHVLRFIAMALITYQKRAAVRKWQALWQTSILANFEAESEKLASLVEIEASNCGRALDAQRWQDAKHWKRDLETELQTLDEIQGVKDSIDRLHVKADLTKLTTAVGATYNSYADGDSARCLQGTRTLLLDQVINWADDPNGKYIFWLCGMAGTGKSTISRNISHILDKQRRLAASFFFKRGEGDRANASRFFPTIAAQLADMIPGPSHFMAHALDADSFLCQKNIQEQFEKLLSEPLLNLSQRVVTPLTSSSLMP